MLGLLTGPPVALGTAPASDYPSAAEERKARARFVARR
jgi:hypothetical protein